MFENPQLKLGWNTDRATAAARDELLKLDFEWKQKEQLYKVEITANEEDGDESPKIDEVRRLESDLEVFNKTGVNEIIVECSEHSESQYNPEEEPFSLKDLLADSRSLKNDRYEFEMSLHDSVRGIKQLVQSLKAQIKWAKTDKDKQAVKVTQDKIQNLIAELKLSLKGMSTQLKQS